MPSDFVTPCTNDDARRHCSHTHCWICWPRSSSSHVFPGMSQRTTWNVELGSLYKCHCHCWLTRATGNQRFKTAPPQMCRALYHLALHVSVGSRRMSCRVSPSQTEGRTAFFAPPFSAASAGSNNLRARCSSGMTSCVMTGRKPQTVDPRSEAQDSRG